MNYNSFYNKPTLNHKELIGDIKASDIGGMTEEDMQELLETDLTPYYSKDEIDDLFSRSFVYREKSGSIVTFDCPSTSQSIPEVTVGIEATQDLHGYDNPWAGGAGKNKFDVDLPHTIVSGADTYQYDLTLKPNTTYTMSSNVPYDNPASLYFNGGVTNVNGVWSGTSRTFTSDANGNITAYVRYNTSQGGIDLYTAVKNGTYYIQLEEGETATTFAPYSNICPISGWSAVNVYDGPTTDPQDATVYTTALKDANDQPLTCYGGQLVNENGVQTLTVTHANIASYNGETINEPWISSMDVYSEGATPTTGAQVVYPLTTPTEIPQQSQAISTQDGTNNLWTDSGEIEVKCLDRIIPAGE